MEKLKNEIIQRNQIIEDLNSMFTVLKAFTS